VLTRLADPQLYVASAERVLARQLRSGDQRPLVYAQSDGSSPSGWQGSRAANDPGERSAVSEQGRTSGPRLARMAGELEPLARQLAREVSRGRYAFGPVSCRQVRFGGKLRALYLASPLDDIVLGALAQVLAELFDGALAPGLYSYRRGRSAGAAIKAFGAYLRAHGQARPDPRARGLYVVRRDIRNYGDSIGAGPSSVLWTLLADALRRAAVQPTPALLGWLRSAFRPNVATGQDALEQPEKGVPTGSPLQPLACNLYLGPLDRLCEVVQGGFYARYGDDVLFAHPDPARAELTQRAMDALIETLGLAPSPGKCASYYFTGAGRASPRPGFRGVSSLDYLGVRIDFGGAIGLPRHKLRALLGDVRARLARSAALLEGEPVAQRARTLASVVNAAVDPEHALAHPSAQLLCTLVDDRAQLRDLDYKLASCLAQALAARGGVRAFRDHPPRALRAQAGLCSLVRVRDRARERAEPGAVTP
jgi:hypothetical protein